MEMRKRRSSHTRITVLIRINDNIKCKNTQGPEDLRRTRPNEKNLLLIKASHSHPVKMTSEVEAPTSSNMSSVKRSPPLPADASQSATKRSKLNKFDPSVLPESSDAAEILKQVEFYFSDANLPRDKFLWTLTQSDPKNQGWVQISQIASFKRMQRFKPLEAIVEALRHSKELLEVSEDGTAVRRKIPLVKPTNEEFQELNNRIVYAVIYSLSFLYPQLRNSAKFF